MTRNALALSLLVGILGCSSDEPGSPGGNAGAPGSTCSAAAAEFCEKSYQCAPFLSQAAYASMAQCTQIFGQQCEKSVQAPGSNTRGSDVGACVDSLAKLTCRAFNEAIESGKWPTACGSIAGVREDGEPCYIAAQCKGRLCRTIMPQDECGECDTQPGNECEKVLCNEKTFCNGNTCVYLASQLDACQLAPVELGCGSRLHCVPTSCEISSLFLPEGASCGTTELCDLPQGLRCGDAKVCEKTSLADEGQSCADVVCKGGLFCNLQSRVCEPTAREGQPCTQYNSCLQPATCQEGFCRPAQAPRCEP